MKSMRKYEKKLEIQKAKNPGKANREARKAERGETFLGFRPSRMDSKKHKALRRSEIKKQTRRELNFY